MTDKTEPPSLMLVGMTKQRAEQRFADAMIGAAIERERHAPAIAALRELIVAVVSDRVGYGNMPGSNLDAAVDDARAALAALEPVTAPVAPAPRRSAPAPSEAAPAVQPAQPPAEAAPNGPA